MSGATSHKKYDYPDIRRVQGHIPMTLRFILNRTDSWLDTGQRSAVFSS